MSIYADVVEIFVDLDPVNNTPIYDTLVNVYEPKDDGIIASFMVEDDGYLRALSGSCETYRALAEETFSSWWFDLDNHSGIYSYRQNY